MMNRQSTRHAEDAEPLHREDAQDAQGIRMWKKEEIGVVVVVV
jgi:hypothetical protein